MLSKQNRSRNLRVEFANKKPPRGEAWRPIVNSLFLFFAKSLLERIFRASAKRA